MNYRKVISSTTRKMRKASGAVGDFTEGAGKGIGRTAVHIYSDVEDQVEDAREFVGHIAAKTRGIVESGVDEVVDSVRDRAATMVEREVNQLVQQARQQIGSEIRPLIPGGAILASGLIFTALSGLLLGFACVALLTDVFHLPLWAAYLLVSSMLAVVGIYLVRYGQVRLRSTTH